MTKLLIALATTVALVGPAAAGSPVIPKEYHGRWCTKHDKPFFSSPPVIEAYRKFFKAEGEDPDTVVGCGKDSDGWINITAHSYDGWEEWCKPIKVTKTNGGVVGGVKVKLRCTYEGDSGGDTPEIVERTLEVTGESGSNRFIPGAKRLYVDFEKTYGGR
jgi:hypothetical protein